jgi:hypothetical protein
VAEQLGLQEMLGQGGAVDGHERLGGALAVGVNGPRHELLPRAGLVEDEDVGFRPRGLLDELEDAHHDRAPPDDVLEPERLLELLAKVSILALQGAMPERAVDGDAELLAREGLGQVVEGALLHGTDRGLDAGESGDDDDRKVRVDLMGPPQELEAFDVGHLQIGEEDVRALRFDKRQGLVCGGGGQALMTGEGEEPCRILHHLGLVVDDEQLSRHAPIIRRAPERTAPPRWERDTA